MKLAPLEVLSDADLRRIHEASLDILAVAGVQILNPTLFEELARLGFPAHPEDHSVRFPRQSIENALQTVPRTFELYNREGHPAFVLGGGQSRIAAGHNAVFWRDLDSGKTRPSTVADVELFARLCEVLPGIDMIGIPVMPQDVPDPAATLLYGVRACLSNSRKPIFFSTDNPNVHNAIIDMLAAVFPGNMEKQPFGISQLSPTSPLFWEANVAGALMDAVRRNVPLAILPEPNAGISAPYTLAGLLAMNNAECLSGIIIAQVLRPGAKVLYANSWTTTDMRNGYALVGSIETSLCRIAGAQLARFYGIPSHTTAPNSDNHAHDEQNAWEKTFSTMCAVAAGNDLVVNCGMFATGMTCSHEQLLMDEEISNMARRLAAGIRVDDETIAVDSIVKLGPGNPGFLTAEHTMTWLRSPEYLLPRLAVRGPRPLWEASGAKDTAEIARAEVRALAQNTAGAIDDARRGALEEILSAFRSE